MLKSKDIKEDVIIVSAVGILGYFAVVRPILIKLGIIKTADQKKAEGEKDKQLADRKGNVTKAQEDYGSPWYGAYFIQARKIAKPGTSLWKFTDADTKKLCDVIASAKNTWTSDDSKKLLGALNQCVYKTQVSWLAMYFYVYHKMDLLPFCKDVLWGKEYVDLIQRVSKLPNGFVPK